MQSRQLVQQGREAQHTDDLTATVKEAEDATAIQETVDRSSDAQLDVGLERVRHPDTAAGNS